MTADSKPHPQPSDPSDDVMAFEQAFYRDPANANHHLFTADYRRAWAAWRKAQRG